PATVPPGLSIERITAFAPDFEILSSILRRSRSLRISPPILTRATCALEVEVKFSPLRIAASAPTAATAATTARTRQKVSLRRSRLRSTMESTSCDMKNSPDAIDSRLDPRKWPYQGVCAQRKRPAHRRRPPIVRISAGNEREVYSFFSVPRLSALPRMSPNVAPESEEPYCATASFSSAISSAFTETVILRERRS